VVKRVGGKGALVAVAFCPGKEGGDNFYARESDRDGFNEGRERSRATSTQRAVG